jgi:DNA methylase
MIEVRLGRWQDILPGTYDPTLAVIVTDPPYGLGADGGIGERSPGSHMGLGVAGGNTRVQIEKGYADVIPWARHVEEVLDLLPAKRHVIRGPATALIRRDYPQPRRVCVEMAAYRKRALNRPGVVPYLWQGWAVYGRLRIDHHARPPKGDAMTSTFLLQRDRNDHRARSTHRALTPFAACSWIVDNWVDPGCLVVDPFAGLGTIGIAARSHGFDYIGAELVPEYAAIANKAFESEALALGLETA